MLWMEGSRPSRHFTIRIRILYRRKVRNPLLETKGTTVGRCTLTGSETGNPTNYHGDFFWLTTPVFGKHVCLLGLSNLQAWICCWAMQHPEKNASLVKVFNWAIAEARRVWNAVLKDLLVNYQRARILKIYMPTLMFRNFACPWRIGVTSTISWLPDLNLVTNSTLRWRIQVCFVLGRRRSVGLLQVCYFHRKP